MQYESYSANGFRNIVWKRNKDTDRPTAAQPDMVITISSPPLRGINNVWINLLFLLEQTFFLHKLAKPNANAWQEKHVFFCYVQDIGYLLRTAI